jgi:hypothetical protein
MNSREINLYVNSYFDGSSVNDRTHRWTTFLAENITGYNNCKIKLEDIELPNSAYNFAPFTSQLWYEKNPGGGNVTLHNIQINTARVYASVNDLITELNNRFTSNGDDIVATFDANTGKITLTNNLNVDIRVVSSFRYDNDPATNTFNHINDRLGLNQDLTNTIIQPTETLTGNGVVRMLRTNCYYLTADILDGGGSISTFHIPNPSKTGTRVLSKLTAGNFGTLSQLNFGKEVNINVSNKTISSISFSILDDEFEGINLNGLPITFTCILTLT